ncbi:MAG: hypothetical protein PUC54_05655, partial [Clostridiales bacterium]|nr:hypothetical protein [Clostridiales bacterium]
SISQRSFHPAWANLLSHLLSGSFTIYPDKNRIWFHDFQNSLKKIIADFCERFYPCRLRCFSSPLRLPPCGVPRYMEQAGKKRNRFSSIALWWVGIVL